MKFKSRPWIIDAIQFTEQMAIDYILDHLPLPKGIEITSSSSHTADRKVYRYTAVVTTIHGHQTPIVPGDWIVMEKTGEHFYPVKPDIFAEKYEPLKESND